ncbi:MAG: hypothetical protein KA314_30015, partial [Chloroflexi bacterium]|nr:hypothetical protein [Chloroflexota bacterium]MBP8060095.1 hypothetical protein [Chloroflexota bacterium]
GQSIPFSLGITLLSVAGNVGANLIAEQLQRWRDQAQPVAAADVITWVQTQAAHQAELRQTLDELLETFQAIPHAQNSLSAADKTWFNQQLQTEMAQLGNLPRFVATVTGGGAIAQGAGAKAVGQGGVLVEGNVTGPIITGDIKGINSQSTTLRLDTALPNQVQQSRAFELAVSIRQIDSPILKEDDLDKTKSGDVKVSWPEDVKAIDLRVHVQAPECTIHGVDSYAFQLFRGQDSPVFYFQLTPQQQGRIGIVVTVFQEQNFLGGTRLHTRVQEQVAGKVAMQIYSQHVGRGLSHVGTGHTIITGPSAPPVTTLPSLLAPLRDQLTQAFGKSELQSLCFDLGIAYDDLPGDTRTGLAQALISYCYERGRILDLLSRCQKLRPHLVWHVYG